jgi:hypothetical protein
MGDSPRALWRPFRARVAAPAALGANESERALGVSIPLNGGGSWYSSLTPAAPASADRSRPSAVAATNTEEGLMTENEITADRIVATAEELGETEFTRPQLAAKLGVSKRDLKEAFNAAKQSGRLQRVGQNAEGQGVFRLTNR